jgi:hypothetical protein
MSAPLPEFNDQVNEFSVMIVRFFYGLVACICAYIIWGTWKRMKTDVNEGGFSRLALTLVKLVVIVAIGYYGIEYLKTTGFFDEVSQTFHQK